jgi:hypothetical protein
MSAPVAARSAASTAGFRMSGGMGMGSAGVLNCVCGQHHPSVNVCPGSDDGTIDSGDGMLGIGGLGTARHGMRHPTSSEDLRSAGAATTAAVRLATAAVTAAVCAGVIPLVGDADASASATA